MFSQQAPAALAAWPALCFLLPLPVAAAEEAASGLLAAGPQETISLTMTIFRAMASLAIVLAIMFILLHLLKKSGLARHAIRPGSLIRVLDLRSLAPRKQVAVLEVAGEYIVVGIAEQQITLLHTLTDNELLRRSSARAAEEPPALPPSLAAFLQQAGQRLRGTAKKEKRGPHAS